MKKMQKQLMAFQAVQRGYDQIRAAAARSSERNLLHHEAVIRNQIRKLLAVPPQISPAWQSVFDDYSALLDDVSRQLLTRYNRRHQTDYAFETVIAGQREHYLKNGIVSVLLTVHIPRMVSKQFSLLLPKNPQEEYREARTLERRFTLHLGDTNTGKTYQALQRLKAARSGIYLAPLRILALENFERLNREGIPCSLITGEEEFQVPGARHLCCTVEKAVLKSRYDVAVIDEVQLLADRQRGDAWTRAILGLQCREIHLCGAAAAKELLISMIQSCGDDLEIRDYRRLVPLELLPSPVKLTAPEPGDAFVAFSKKRVLGLAGYFHQRGIPCSVIYGDLPPEVRRVQYQKFVSGENTVLVATDAIGMGVNLPVRRIIFTDIQKFDGEALRLLTSQEVKQIAGRAGRIGIFATGYVGALDRDAMEFLEDRLRAEDAPARQAVVGPSEAILQIDLLPLPEKLALWTIQPEPLPFYQKKDLRSELLILDLLKSYHLPETIGWRLMSLPFDVENEVLLAQFETYVNEYFKERKVDLSRPVLVGRMRSDYETYYQQINLYYSFCKTMGTPLDEQWITQRRLQVSQKIERLLERTGPGFSAVHHSA